jgi:hypothetical protein
MLSRSTLWLGAAAILAASSAVWASDSSEQFVDLGAPIAQGTLDERRAGDGRLQFNVQENSANLNDNSVERTLTGSNIIKDGAFSNNAGLPLAVQNTGNNVIIQNAFILNIEVR